MWTSSVTSTPLAQRVRPTMSRPRIVAACRDCRITVSLANPCVAFIRLITSQVKDRLSVNSTTPKAVLQMMASTATQDHSPSHSRMKVESNTVVIDPTARMTGTSIRRPDWRSVMMEPTLREDLLLEVITIFPTARPCTLLVVPMLGTLSSRPNASIRLWRLSMRGITSMILIRGWSNTSTCSIICTRSKQL